MKTSNYSFSQKITPLIILLVFIFYTTNINAQNNVKLEKVWASDAVLLTPECVAIDYENDVLYVSNVNKNPWVLDDNGFISKLNFDGEILELKWVEKMHGPKGMGIYNGFLFVADIDGVIKINTKDGKVVERIAADPALQLNDISIAQDGTVYVSGSNCNSIFKIEKNKLKLFDKDEVNFDRPNGLLAEKDRMLALTSGNGTLFEIDYKNMEKKIIANDFGHGDGIAAIGNGSYLLTDWQGRIFLINSENKVTTLLDSRKEEIYSADIAYYIKKNLLFVPTFFNNRVVAYKLIK